MNARRALSLAVVGRGRMGRLVEAVARERGHRVALTLGAADNLDGAGLSATALAGVELAIEFSTPAAAPRNVEACLERGVSVVTGTTGWADGERTERLRALAERNGVGLLIAPNFALGVLLFRLLVRRAAELLAGDDQGFDLWIEETHHSGKLDAPSGTALALAEDLLERLPGKRREDLSIRSTRGGYEPGLHRVVLDAPDETIELVHRVRSRRVFALGAVRAAEWMDGRTGLVGLEDLMNGSEGGA
jgi:4-hydroxy-tetrahydrodipicolinate reductase